MEAAVESGKDSRAQSFHQKTDCITVILRADIIDLRGLKTPFSVIAGIPIKADRWKSFFSCLLEGMIKKSRSYSLPLKLGQNA